MVPSTPLLPHCAKTVSEPHPFHPMTLLFERKQIPRIVVTIRNSRNSIDRLEPISLPWAQGVGRSNRPAPTKPPAAADDVINLSPSLSIPPPQRSSNHALSIWPRCERRNGRREQHTSSQAPQAVLIM